MHITLAEAASLLGVSKETLRNWDRSGKLKSIRDPNNNYRLYRLNEVKAIAPVSVEEDQATYRPTQKPSESYSGPDDDASRELRRALAKLHKILRDIDGSSSLVERFDEASKLLFLSILDARSGRVAIALERTKGESESNHAKRLRQMFSKVAAANSSLFPERFSSIKLSNSALSAAANSLATVDFSSPRQDVKGLAYEEMIQNTFDKGENQQFFTPQTVASFLVELMGDKLCGAVCDPASGTGGFLVEIAKRKLPVDKLVALEIDERLAWVAGINLFAHGSDNFETHHLNNGGSLGRAGEKLTEAFDAIITNPPFGSDFSERTELERYTLGKGRTSRRRGVLFIERCLRMLKEDGMLGIVIDEGVLSLPSNADVRELILAQSDLLAVISLPETAFMPYASVSTSILLLRKNTRQSRHQLTFYARAESVGRKPNGDADIEYCDQGQASLNNDLPSILSAWKVFEQTGTLPKQTDDIYIASLQASVRTQSDSSNRIDFKFHHPARLAAQIGLRECGFQLATLGQICSIRNESFVPSVDLPDQLIPYTGLAHIQSRTGHAQQVFVSGNSLKSAVKKYYSGDILFAKMRPSLRKVAWTNFEQPGYASAECVVMTVTLDVSGHPIIDPFLLSIILRSDYVYGQIIHLIAGIGRPRIALKDLLRIQVPLPSQQQQADFRRTFLAARANYESLKTQAKQLSETANSMELQAVEDLAQAFIGRE